MNSKKTLQKTKLYVLLDFAENYSFVCQDAVQGFHCNNAQATLHPLAVYYRESEGGELKCTNVCIISDCLKYDTMTVHAFIIKTMFHQALCHQF